VPGVGVAAALADAVTLGDAVPSVDGGAGTAEQPASAITDATTTTQRGRNTPASLRGIHGTAAPVTTGSWLVARHAGVWGSSPIVMD